MCLIISIRLVCNNFVFQCVHEKNVKRISNISLLQNLLLKMNTKLGGINAVIAPTVKPPFMNTKLMVIGADVTHPGPCDKLSTSG